VHPLSLAPTAPEAALDKDLPRTAPERARAWTILPRTWIGPDRQIILTIAAGKAAVLLVVFLAYKLLPFYTAEFNVNFVDPNHPGVSVATAFSTWDGQHYLFLSESGYRAGQMSDAFFPLFPFLVHLLTPVFGNNSLVAALVTANVASLIGLYILFKLVMQLYGAAAARGTLLLYLAFPTAFFFSLVYTESLYLLLAATFFYLLFQGRLAWAAVPAALLPLARPEGVLIIIPFAIYYAVEVLRLDREPLARALGYLRLRQAALVGSPVIGALAYLGFMKAATGNALEMFQAMKVYVSAHSITYILHPLQLAHALGQWPLAIHGYTNSLIDRAIFACFLLLLVPMFRRLHPALAWYALAVGSLNVLSGTFMSYSRYVLLAFPIFITAALLFERPAWRVWRAPLACVLAGVQGLFLVMQALNYWVA